MKLLPLIGLVLSAAFFTPLLPAQTTGTSGDESVTGLNPFITLKPFTTVCIPAPSIFAPYDEAIKLNPKNAQAYADRARVESIQGDQADTDRALADYSQAIALKPGFAEAYYGRARLKDWKGNHKGARADFDKVIELNPKSADAYAHRADFLAAFPIDDRDGAIADYSQAIALDSNQAKFYSDRGFLEYVKGWLGNEKSCFDAIADYSKAIQLNPNDTASYCRRGSIYEDQGRFDRAFADYDKAVELHGYMALSSRGLAKFEQGDLDGALVDLSNDNTYHGYRNCGNRAAVEQAKGDFEAAISDYTEAVGDSTHEGFENRFFLFLTLRRLHRNVSPAGLDATTIKNKDDWEKTVGLYLTGQLPEAVFLAKIKSIAKLRADNRGFTPHGLALYVEKFKCWGSYYVGMMHLLADDPRAAEEFFKKCLAIKLPIGVEGALARAELARLQTKNLFQPAIPAPTTAEDYDRQGNIKRLKERDMPGAIADFNKAIELQPKYAEPYVDRGIAELIAAMHENEGDESRIIADFDEAIALKPGLALAYCYRGALRYEKDINGAMADFAMAIELNPQDANTYALRGFARYDRDRGGAIADLNKVIELNLKHFIIYSERGLAKKDNSDVDSTIALYDGAIEDRDKDDYLHMFHMCRGIAKESKGDFEGAIADFGEIIEHYVRVSMAYEAHGFMGEVPDRQESSTAYKGHGLAEMGCGEVDRAIADFDKAIDLDPKNALGYTLRAHAKQAKHDIAGAITDFDKAIELNPNDSGVYHDRGLAKQEEGDNAGATADLKKATDLPLRPPLD